MGRLLFAAIMTALVAVTGAAIADDAMATPYLVAEFQSVGLNVVGLVPEGLRFDAPARGVITDGLLAGATMTGIDYVLMRHDGVGIIDARWFVEHPNGVTVALTARGYSGEPAPGVIEAMIDPAFVPPDVDIPIHGAIWMETMAPQYAFLNHTVFGFTGTSNWATGVLRVTARSLAP